MPTAKYKNPQPPVKPPRHRRCVYRDSVFVYVFVKQRKRATEKERERERVRFQVNYSIIAVDILLFVAVVDRRPAAESGSLSTLFAPRILAISRARAFPRRLDYRRCRGRGRYFRGCESAFRRLPRLPVNLWLGRTV